jgi:hypothetical protein
MMERRLKFETGNTILPMRQPTRRTFVGLLAVLIVLTVLIACRPASDSLLAQAPDQRTNAIPPKQKDTDTVANVDAVKKASAVANSDFLANVDVAGNINAVANRTLGFTKVFVIGLPERTDKRDALALTSAVTGFSVDFIDGIKGESVSNKAVPLGVDRQVLMETNLGSWRGHMNAIRR